MTLTLLIAIILLIVGVLVSSPIIKDANMYLQCCNGKACTDTYYIMKDNQCHLVGCEINALIKDKSTCVYDGANITNGTVI